MMKIIKYLKSLFIVSFFPMYVVLLFILYKYGVSRDFRNVYEIFFIGWFLILLFFRFKLTQNVLVAQALALYFVAIVLDAVKRDTPAVYFSNLAFVSLLLILVVIVIRLLFKIPKTVNPKKVLFIANAIVGQNPGVSGGESRFIEIGKEWVTRGYEVHLLGAQSASTLCEKMGLKVKLHCLTNSRKDNRLEFFIRTIMLFFYLPVLAMEFDEGIVYSTSEQIYDVIPGAFLKFVYPDRIAFASAVHWLPPVLFWKRQSSKWYNSLFFMLSERLGLLLGCLTSDVLFPVSSGTYDDMRKSGLVTDRTYIVKCGVNMREVSEIASRYPDKKQEAVFMKRIQAVKGIFDLIDLWEIVLKSRPGAYLKIIGSGIDENRAKALVREKGIENNIGFTGVIYDTEEKYKIISESKLFLLPSYEENWAIVIGEAMATGVPIICYDLKELKEVWQDSVVFIKTGDKKMFADKIIELLDDAVSYDRIKTAGLKYVQQYSWSTIAEEELACIVNGIL